MAKTWKDRLIKEEAKLDRKVDELTSFIEEDEYFDTLKESDRDLLMAQHAAMTAYLNILAIRMKRHGLLACEDREKQKTVLDDFMESFLNNTKEMEKKSNDD